VADRLEALVRAGRALSPEPPRYAAPEPPRPTEAPPPAAPADTGPRLHSQAERDLLRVLRKVR
jgi:hypothetical protein